MHRARQRQPRRTAPATPKATLQAVIDAYDLAPGDAVYVDTGLYEPADNTVIGADDEGSAEGLVRFQGSPNGTIIDRGDTNTSSFAFQLNNCQYVEVNGFEVRGAGSGLWLGECSYCRIRGNVIRQNGRGIELNDYGDFRDGVIANNVVVDNDYGMWLEYGGDRTDAMVCNNTFAGNSIAAVYLGYVGLRDGGFCNNIFFQDGGGHCIYNGHVSLSYAASDHNLFFVTNGAHVGFFDGSFDTLTAWRRETGLESNSLAADPLFVAPTHGDFHVRSSGGTYVSAQGGWTNFTGEASPGLDTGGPLSAYGAEPDLNGGRINLGAYGNTAQASKTPTNRIIRLVEPVGGERYPDQDTPVMVRWSLVGGDWHSNDTLRLSCSLDSGLTWSTIAGAESIAATNRLYAWDVSGLATGQYYRAKLTCNQDELATIASTANFAIGTYFTFYVNDGSIDGDAWCTAPGHDSRDGRTPASPKATVQAVNGTIIDRGNTSPGSFAFQLSNCQYVEVNGFEVRGAGSGLWLGECSYCRIKSNVVRANGRGIELDGYGDFRDGVIANNVVVGNDYGMYLDFGGDRAGATVRNNTLAGNGTAAVYLDYNGLGQGYFFNNILSQDGGGYCMYSKRTPVPYAASDYNLFFVTNGAHVGYYQEDRESLADWQGATGMDGHSPGLDPLFVAPTNGDFHLQSAAGSYHKGGWTLDAQDSPGIDTGDPTSDSSREWSFPNQRLQIVNLGAYGNTPEASRSRDSDGDGFSNTYEQFRMGTRWDRRDSDGDGSDDDEELYADTDPTNPNSVLRLTGIGETTEGTWVAWEGGRNVMQYLQRCENPLAHSSTWRTIHAHEPPMPVTNYVVDITATNDILHYRIRVNATNAYSRILEH